MVIRYIHASEEAKMPKNLCTALMREQLNCLILHLILGSCNSYTINLKQNVSGQAVRR